MSKRMAVLIGLALALLPAAGSAQQIGVSVRVQARVEQPDLVASGAMAGAARIPAGWAWSVERGSGGGRSSRVARVESMDSLEAVPVLAANERGGEVVTWTFVPL